MAYTCRRVRADPTTVFGFLADPTTYPTWLVGASQIRDHDESWPAPGSVFHHRVGVWPLLLSDTTVVLDVRTDEMLRLSVRARPLISAEVTFTLSDDAGGTVVCMEEEPSLRLIGNLVRPVLDPFTHVRNHRSLRRLDQLLSSSRMGAA